MDVKYYQVNAFTKDFNGGNPAGVCPLKEWLPDELMQAIARENNLSETAFFVANEDEFDLRWFTPSIEVDLCGHATLASAHALFSEMQYSKDTVLFNTRSGKLLVSKHDDKYLMEMPVIPVSVTAVPDNLVKGIGREPVEAYKADDYMLVYDDAEFIRNLEPDFSLTREIDLRGTIVTALSNEAGIDFVSRFFGSTAVGIDEDPVTGSAHCMLTPYWSEKLLKTKLVARQVSNRGGQLSCQLKDDKVLLSGNAVTYLKGVIYT